MSPLHHNHRHSSCRHPFVCSLSSSILHVMSLFVLCFLVISSFQIQVSFADDDSVCYFPIEYQGTFLMQEQLFGGISSGSPSPSSSGGSTGGLSSSIGGISYSEITVEADSIPVWGRCYRRRGNIVILKDSTGNQDCMRCIHLTLKTPNVIQIHAEGLARCYTNEDAAKAKCPSEADVRRKTFKEIMLFRKHVPGGLQTLEHRFCPFNGRYRFNYISNNKQTSQCDSSLNELGNCPHGDALGIKFRGCPFPNMDLNFLCLGDWETNVSGKDERYVALMDLRESPDTGPKYRCGLYREDSTGTIYVSLSSDSTCLTGLKSATSGYESFILTLNTSTSSFPDFVEASKCRFPDWTQATWEDSKIRGNTFVYKDEEHNYQTVTSKCVMRQTSTSNERFVVYSKTQCGDESYRCIWFKRRSPNIMEFQFGQEASPFYSDVLCDDKQFPTNNWITQGRIKVSTATPCPITGDYSGVIPGSSGLCAKVASDCNNPDIMFYTVTACENRSHILEEREYKCLGNWEEDSILYTYTERRDMPGYQCFAGKINRSGEEAFIKEAGESCIRGEDPTLFGMNITKEAPCPRLLTPSVFPKRPVVPPATPTPPTPSTVVGRDVTRRRIPDYNANPPYTFKHSSFSSDSTTEKSLSWSNNNSPRHWTSTPNHPSLPSGDRGQAASFNPASVSVAVNDYGSPSPPSFVPSVIHNHASPPSLHPKIHLQYPSSFLYPQSSVPSSPSSSSTRIPLNFGSWTRLLLFIPFMYFFLCNHKLFVWCVS